MKAKLYIGLMSAMLLPGSLTLAQIANDWSYRNDNTGTVINNSYNYDYYYSSRINRFHRSYSTFTYYSPVYTDTYWYSYQPFARGISIYGGSSYGFGIVYNQPAFYSYGWDYPAFGGSYYWGFEPYYYSWFSPVVVSIRIGSYYPRNYYSWNVRNRYYNDYRPVYNTYNNYYYNSSSSGNSGSYSGSSRRSSSVTTTNTVTNDERRGTTHGNAGQNINNGNRNDKTNNGLHLGETRRNTNPSNQGGSSTNIGNRGNNNNINPGNSNNANRRTVSSQNQGNQANQGNNMRTTQGVNQAGRSQVNTVNPSRSGSGTVSRTQTAAPSGRTATSGRSVTSSPASKSSGSSSVKSNSAKSGPSTQSDTKKTGTGNSGTRRK